MSLSHLSVLVAWNLGVRLQYGNGAAGDNDSFNSRACRNSTRLSIIVAIKNSLDESLPVVFNAPYNAESALNSRFNDFCSCDNNQK
jgi:hypothetical protein